jgi:NTE family protein
MSKSKILFLIVLHLGLLGIDLMGQSAVAVRPKIGLVLSGGGAKGLAHIGVLKVLEEVGLPIDYITGTSMGSVIGGLLACGYSAKEIEDIARSLDWNKLLADEISRKNISIVERDEYNRYLWEFPLVKWKVVMPLALVGGQNIATTLAHYTLPIHNITNFDSFPIPFRCIATDIEQVKPVVLRRGYLPDAIRASMAIPSFFSPVELEGHILVDGGIVRNFPVQDAHEMGADIVIGVEVSASLYPRKELNSLVRIMDQISSSQSYISNAEQDKLCDVLIKPNIEKYGLFSFNDIDSLILNGERAARQYLPKLKALADSIRQLGKISKPIRPVSDLEYVHVIETRYEGLEKVSKSLVKANFLGKDTGWVKLKDIEDGVEKLYGTRFFENVNYKILPVQHGSNLILRFKEQNSNYFKFSMHYDPYLEAALLFTGSYRNFILEGSHALIDVKVGQYPGINLKYTIYTFGQPNVGLTIRTTAKMIPAVYYSSEGLIKGNYSTNHYLGEFDLFSSLSKGFLIRSGLQAEFFDIQNKIEIEDTINLNFQSYSWYSRIRFDTQNKTIFPTKGDNFYGELKYIYSSRDFGNFGWDRRFWRLITAYTKYIPLSKKFVLIPNLNVGCSFANKVPAPYYNYLGGFVTGETNIFPFDGMRFMAIYSNYIVSSTLGLQFEFWKDKFLTIRSNYATISSNFEDLRVAKYKYFSTGLAFGLKTIVGPIEFSVSKSNINKGPLGELKVGYLF